MGMDNEETGGLAPCHTRKESEGGRTRDEERQGFHYETPDKILSKRISRERRVPAIVRRRSLK